MVNGNVPSPPRRVAISWRAAVAPPLRVPCALTKAFRALPSPNTTAAGRAEMARAAGRSTARLHCHPHGSGRGHATCHGRLAVATTGDTSIGDGHGKANARRTVPRPSDDDDTPSAIKTAPGQRWTGKAKAGEEQDTRLDPETAAGHGGLPSSFVVDCRYVSVSAARSPSFRIIAHKAQAVMPPVQSSGTTQASPPARPQGPPAAPLP